MPIQNILLQRRKWNSISDILANSHFCPHFLKPIKKRERFHNSRFPAQIQRGLFQCYRQRTMGSKMWICRYEIFCIRLGHLYLHNKIYRWTKLNVYLLEIWIVRSYLGVIPNFCKLHFYSFSLQKRYNGLRYYK